jgi:hypothetical protein
MYVCAPPPSPQERHRSALRSILEHAEREFPIANTPLHLRTCVRQCLDLLILHSECSAALVWRRFLGTLEFPHYATEETRAQYAVVVAALRTQLESLTQEDVSEFSEMFTKLLEIQPLTPLTGDPSEWLEPDSDGTCLSLRHRDVYKDAEGKAFLRRGLVVAYPRDPTQTAYTDDLPLMFPCIPTPQSGEFDRRRLTYVRYAERELDLAGTSEEIRESVLNLLEIFDQEGHSGMSSSWAVGLFAVPPSERPPVEAFSVSTNGKLAEIERDMSAAMAAHLRVLDSELDLSPAHLHAAIRRVFQKVALFQPLTPLTGDDDEWAHDGRGQYQNNRCVSVFKDATGAYQTDAIIWREDSGACFRDSHSRQPVVFPYVPVRTVKPVSEHP